MEAVNKSLEDAIDVISEDIKKRTHIIIINGLGGHGKGEFIKAFTEVGYESKSDCLSKELSTVDFVKEVAVYCGWRGEKESKDRQFLHELKEALTKWGDIPNKTTLAKIQEIVKTQKFVAKFTPELQQGLSHIFIFVNIRESVNIESFTKLCKDNGYVNIRKLIIWNPNKPSNEVPELRDDILYGIEYDDVINNDGTLKDLKTKAEDYFDFLVSGRESYYT